MGVIKAMKKSKGWKIIPFITDEASYRAEMFIKMKSPDGLVSKEFINTLLSDVLEENRQLREVIDGLKKFVDYLP